MTYNQFTFFDGMNSRWAEFGKEWGPLKRSDSSNECAHDTPIIHCRLVTYGSIWSNIENILIKIDWGEIIDDKGHAIVFTIYQIFKNIVMQCKVYEDTDDIEIILLQKKK